MNSHIFIVHTAFQELIAEASAASIKKNSPTDLVILASEIPLSEKNHPIWNNRIQLKNIEPSSFGKNKETLYEENILKLKLSIQDKIRKTLYISDIQWPFNNRLFFDKNINKENDFNMIIDGTLAYYNPQKTALSYFKDTIKHVAGIIGLGLQYKPYLGSVMGWERKRIKLIYGLNLKLSPIPQEKHRNIEQEIIQFGELDKNKSIFLDQPFHNHMSAPDIQSLSVDTYNFIKKQGLANTFYKAHHFSKNEYKNTYGFNNENILNTTECIEKLIGHYGFGTVISYNSTALFTLKTIYQDKIRCISLRDCSLRMKINPASAKKIDTLFYKSGVEIHEIG